MECVKVDSLLLAAAAVIFSVFFKIERNTNSLFVRLDKMNQCRVPAFFFFFLLFVCFVNHERGVSAGSFSSSSSCGIPTWQNKKKVEWHMTQMHNRGSKKKEEDASIIGRECRRVGN